MLVVGAGSAGSILAERLSADPGRTVLVLEAGPPAPAPGVAAVLPIGPDSTLVRRYDTDLTDHPARPARLVRGAVVGGSGAVNGGYFCRAQPADLTGMDLPGWDWPTVAAAFAAIETDRDFATAGHGAAGPIPVARATAWAPATERFVAAARRAGAAWHADLNDDTGAAGVGPVPLNIDDGHRAGPGTAVLAPVAGRANLTVRTGVRALRLRLHRGRAIGVEVAGPAGLTRIDAGRIVLCAGAIESALLLMRSGIGPAAQLAAAGVPVLADLPVGQRCADHPEWLVPAPWPATAGHPVLEAVLHTDDGIEMRPYTSDFATMTGIAPAGAAQLGVALMRPRARGVVELTGADPASPPRIRHHYDAEREDLARLRDAVRFAGEIFGVPTESVEPVWSTSQHLCGSAPMGRDGDPSAVLDPSCRVRGVDGLWVIDGSALPAPPSRGPHATIAALAHRAAAFVV